MNASKYKGKQNKRMFEPETNLTEIEPNLHDFLIKRVKMEIPDEDREDNIKIDAVERNDFEEPSNESDGIIMVHMDIREPLTSLRLILEEKLNRSLADYSFVLQDSQNLEGHKNLVDQCVQGEGLVQVNVAILSDSIGKRINIVDVLKPPEEYVEIGEKIGDDHEDSVDPDEDVMRFVVDPSFQKDQTKYQIPGDPLEWDESHVRHWLLWAVRQFNLTGIDLTDWEINGKELCELTLSEFKSKVPNDPDELFWTHYQLLKKSVNPSPKLPLKIKQEKIDEDEPLSDGQLDEPQYEMLNLPDTRAYSFHGSQSTSFSSHIKLWQFLLELLTDVRYREFIQWLDTEGEFKLINPEFVAQLWGVRKQKPFMNYEKLSRALRYYYDGNMLCKVNGKRFTYKFVCDLKQLIGYSASELNTLVLEAEEKIRKKNLSKNSIDNAILIQNLFS